MRSLLVTPQFRKDLAKISTEIRQKSNHLTSILLENPLDPKLNIRKSTGIKDKVYRVRIGQYRLTYSFTETSFTLHRFRHRKDIYRGI